MRRTGALLLATASLILPGKALAADVTISSRQLGNIFAPGEPIGMTVAGAAGLALWHLLDQDGDVAARGRTVLEEGGTALQLPDPGLGYFELVVEPMACAPGCARRIALAVVPPAEPGAGPFGVMTHVGHGWAQDFLPLLARIGITHVRDEQYWAQLEREPGRFDFPQPYVDYMALLRQHQMIPLLEMTFGNPHYDNGTTPTSPAARAAYGRFGAALVQRYPEQVTALEVWNEINGTWCDGDCPADRIGAYLGLLEAAWDAVKRPTPRVTIVGGATAGIPLPWWRRLAERGGLARMDVVSVHSYRRRPEGVEDEIEELRAIMRAHGGEKPIWITETGEGNPGEAERRAAASWLVKQLTILLSTGVERIYWYLARDAQYVHGMGLLRAPDSELGALAPNPAYVAYAAVIRELRGARFIKREQTDPRTRLYLFRRGPTEVRVAWSSSGEAELAFSSDAPLSVRDGQGRPARLEASRLRLGPSPVFIIGTARLEHERRTDRLIADLTPSIAASAGGSWRYGYALRDPDEADSAEIEFQPLVELEDDWSRYWGDPRWTFLKLDGWRSEPSIDADRQLWAVRRWTAAEPAWVTISGEVLLQPSEGDGVDVIVAVDGKRLRRRALRPGETWRLNETASVGAGSTIDIAVTPGPALNADFDAAWVEVAVTTPSEAEVKR